MDKKELRHRIELYVDHGIPYLVGLLLVLIIIEFVLTKLEAEDENMKIAGRFSVRGFPTVIAFIRGEEVDRFHSAQTHDFVRNFIDQNLENF